MRMDDNEVIEEMRENIRLRLAWERRPFTAKDGVTVHVLPHDWAFGILQSDREWTCLSGDTRATFGKGDHLASRLCGCYMSGKGSDGLCVHWDDQSYPLRAALKYNHLSWRYAGQLVTETR